MPRVLPGCAILLGQCFAVFYTSDAVGPTVVGSAGTYTLHRIAALQTLLLSREPVELLLLAGLLILLSSMLKRTMK